MDDPDDRRGQLIQFPGTGYAADTTGPAEPAEIAPSDMQRAVYRCLAYDAHGSARFTWGEATWEIVALQCWRVRIHTGGAVLGLDLETVPTPRILHHVHRGICAAARDGGRLAGIVDADAERDVEVMPDPRDRR